MSLLAHPEVLRRRRVWDEKEFIEPQHGRRTPEEVEADRQRIIKEEIARREREHQLHLAQFNSEGVYATDETHIVFTLSILLVCMMLVIYPWQSSIALWKPEHYTDGKNATTIAWKDFPDKMRKNKAPPMPRPSPVPHPRRLDVSTLFLKKRPKSVPAPAKAMPIVESKKDLDLASKEEEETSRLQDNQLGPTPSTGQGPVAEEKEAPPSPTQTQGSQDWTSTLAKRVSKRLEKGRRML
ncbi:uncharacterized protein FA14DRAFT_188126 [Meira miltonrushii]|uniref:Uncharacterized protein n=1 Tax=Meira miltonrushii TaxID=1280837 RepID=A0A316VRH4_9BASI|nr:uncharacterized protein FA14DRAFT_188126 [Meira miltonrushii]PWN38095.1 hypothetical protein FA14DRAFT_188126 [Meira miltonrushii]